MSLATTNQNALFQHSISSKFICDIGSWWISSSSYLSPHCLKPKWAFSDANAASHAANRAWKRTRLIYGAVSYSQKSLIILIPGRIPAAYASRTSRAKQPPEGRNRSEDHRRRRRQDWKVTKNKSANW